MTVVAAAVRRPAPPRSSARTTSSGCPATAPASSAASIPATETWKVYTLPTAAARRGAAVRRLASIDRTGDVWITGSNSDTLIRFRPATEEFTVFPLPTNADFTREIEFGDDGSSWTCTSDQEIDARACRAPAASSSSSSATRGGSCGDGVAPARRGLRRRQHRRLRRLLGRCTRRDRLRRRRALRRRGVRRRQRDRLRRLLRRPARSRSASACGDGIVNAACGEECDPPGALCTAECTARAGLRRRRRRAAARSATTATPPTATAAPPTCTRGDRLRRRRALRRRGVRRRQRASPATAAPPSCAVEVGAACGDGIVNAPAARSAIRPAPAAR